MELIGILGQRISATVSRLGILLLAAVVGLGVPFGWIWIGSQIQEGTAPSWTALAVVHVGMIGTLLLIAGFFSWFIARARARERERPDWMQGMTEQRTRGSITDTHPLELIIFFAVFVDIIVFLVWFFVFANPGTPVGQG